MGMSRSPGRRVGAERFVKLRVDDLESVYAAVKYFNEMGEDADINRSLGLLEEAQRTLKLFLPDAQSKTSGKSIEKH